MACISNRYAFRRLGYIRLKFKKKQKMKFFEVAVQIIQETTDKKGDKKIKKVKKSYLVNSMTVTEAEARVVKEMEETGGMGEFYVLGVTGSRVYQTLEVEGENAENYYDVCVEVEDNETEKKFKENFLVISKDLFSVGDKVEWFYANFKSYEIIGIKKSKITEIINVK